MALNELRIVVIDGGKVNTNTGNLDTGQKKVNKKLIDATPKPRMSPEEKIKRLREIKRAGGSLTDEERAVLKKADTERIANTLNAVKDPISTTQLQIRKYTAIGGAVAGLGIQFAKQAFNYHVSNIGRTTGDSNYQAIINRKIEIVNDYMNVGTSVLGGAAAGMMVGNIPGAVIGAVTGLASSLMNIGFRQYEREQNYAHQMFEQSQSQAEGLKRANNQALTGRVR